LRRGGGARQHRAPRRAPLLLRAAAPRRAPRAPRAAPPLQVLNELAGDKSLERFRIEYDTLYRALKKSHGAAARHAWGRMRQPRRARSGARRRLGGPAPATTHHGSGPTHMRPRCPRRRQ
jgi:hypothetical protein